MTSNGTQSTIIPTTEPEFPWLMGEKLYAIPLNNKFVQMQQLMDNLNNQIQLLTEAQDTVNLGVAITTNWGGGNIITAGPYVLTPSAPYEFTIASADFHVGLSGGTFIFTVLNDGVPVDGLSNVLVHNDYKTNLVAIGHNVVRRNGELDILIRDITGLPIDCYICINGVTNAVSEPVVGVGVGLATGTSFVFGIMTSAATGAALGSATGSSTVVGQIQAAFLGKGAATGSSTATAMGAGIVLGGRVGTASGSSTANAVGSSATGTPTLVLDDPNIGILDINPLG
jgi:hypothetical protein